MIGLTPDLTEVAALRDGVLRLAFADGVTGEVDVLERMRGPAFDDARTPEGFARARVDHETGTVVWPGPISIRTRCTSASERAPGRITTSLLDSTTG
jgi:Protein of unknown function (DUF2442)